MRKASPPSQPEHREYHAQAEQARSDHAARQIRLKQRQCRADSQQQ